MDLPVADTAAAAGDSQAGAGADMRPGASVVAGDRRPVHFAGDIVVDTGSVADAAGIGAWPGSPDSGDGIGPGERFPVAVVASGDRHPVAGDRPGLAEGDTGAGHWPQRVDRHLGRHRAGTGPVAAVDIDPVVVPLAVHFPVGPVDTDSVGIRTYSEQIKVNSS